MLAVVVFHLRFSALPGGFLGVDVFFVISGFLITYLLVTDVLSTRALGSVRVRLRRFYLRRARRLLPSVWALVAVVVAAALLFWHDQLPTLVGGAFSSLTYVTNWWLITDKQSYFVATGRPPMLQHLWSLAIEEQYYLLWPVLLLGLMRGQARQRANRVRLVVLAGIGLALASTLVMAVYAHAQDLPYGADTSRVYFGSDTHSMGLFLGSAAGAWYARHRLRPPDAPAILRMPALPGLLDLQRSPRRRGSAGATAATGAVALAVVVYLCFHVDEYAPALYRGGFLAFDALVLVVLMCAIRTGSALGRFLDARPLRWVGVRSYSIYLWHWPIVVVTRPDLDVHGPQPLVDVARFVLILGISALAYRLVEEPLRAHAGTAATAPAQPPVAQPSATQPSATQPPVSRHSVTRPRHAADEYRPRAAWAVNGLRRPPVALGTFSVVAGVALWLTSFPGLFGSDDATVTVTPAAAASPPTWASPTPTPAPSGHQVHPPSGGSVTADATAKPTVSAFGDSVLLGASRTLRAQVARLDLDAVVGRQAQAVLADIRADASAGHLAPYVVIHVGDNGVISPSQLTRTLQALHSRTRVVLLTVRVPRAWESADNRTIRSVGSKFPNVVVVDWHDRSAGKTSWFVSDGTHLTGEGARNYTALVVRALS